MRNVTGQLVSIGHAEQADPLTEELVTRNEATLNGHWHVAAFKIERARARTDLGKFEASEADLLDAYSALSARFDPNNRFVELARSNRVELHESWDKAEPGAGHAETAETWRQHAPADEPPDKPADKTASRAANG
ncbi:MAG: hypothetical protein AAGI53_04305 [Planctomycetota bacterium]